VQNEQGHNDWQETTVKLAVEPVKAAIIVCEMWDDHWSRGAVERVEVMLPRMNAVLQSARQQGVRIIHAPSETMAFYEGVPARQRILKAPFAAPPPISDHPEPPLPVDASDGGSDTGETEMRKVWSRQHPDLEIDQDNDVISDNGQEIYNYICQHDLTQLFIMGVHTNMCILNRSFAIKQLVRWNQNVCLVRDLTDAMYNPARPPYVSHEAGTAMVIGYIERFWCPTVTSDIFLVS
jgi:nicotinamidase-related amidase